ncbi:MAG: peptide-N-glycosidase F-related protein [Ignavibacteriaceae bacterium]
MKKYLLFPLSIIAVILTIITCNSTEPDEKVEPETEVSEVVLFDKVLYYDGYAEIVNEPVPEGKIRLANSRYAAKVPDSFITSINNKLEMEIVVKAACDNYDRIGSVFLTLINKGESYDRSKIVSQIELARFITPFMDKNKTPDEVPYKFNIDNIGSLFADPDYNSKFDFWMELDIFGVPYAANEQISGCAGRNDVFYGTLTLLPGEKNNDKPGQYLLPVANYVTLNNYNHTDEIGKTIISFTSEITSPVKNASIYLITSNHGANEGGEEYNRREHYLYLDNQLIEMYIPGGKSCEPFRGYNTQRNGIYGNGTRTDAEWSSFSNWCPGDVIPIRKYDIGTLSKGNHTFKFEVPDAQFVNQRGEIPLSIYIQGEKE